MCDCETVNEAIVFLNFLDQCRLTDAVHPAGIVPVVVTGQLGLVLLLILTLDHWRLGRVERPGSDERTF